jgi:hypothetical protein
MESTTSECASLRCGRQLFVPGVQFCNSESSGDAVDPGKHFTQVALAKLHDCTPGTLSTIGE